MNGDHHDLGLRPLQVDSHRGLSLALVSRGIDDDADGGHLSRSGDVFDLDCGRIGFDLLDLHFTILRIFESDDSRGGILRRRQVKGK